MNIDSATFVSPNHNTRKLPISMIVIHATADDNEIGTTEYMLNPAPKDPKTKEPSPELAVSSHYVIWKDGSIKQLVSDDRRAWHAGVSSWNGISDVNSASIGIELVNRNDGKDHYTPEQIDALTALVKTKMHQYDIALHDVVRHADITTRKNDPKDAKGFDWSEFKESLIEFDRWELWGKQFPLHIDARGFGIPTAWYAPGVAENLGAALSHELFGRNYSYIAFERGMIVFTRNKPHVYVAENLR